MTSKIKENNILVEIDQKLYSKSITAKSLYWLSRSYKIDQKVKGSMLEINFKPFDSTLRIEEHQQIIQNTFLDFNLREIVNNETRAIRELIIAKAFHPIENII